MPRIICSFSCGAASAVATKLALAEFDEVEIVNIEVKEEHPDNRRFLADCEKWFGQKVTTIRDEKYNASTMETFWKKKFIIGPKQCPCSSELKKRVINAWYRLDDEVVIGFTTEEQSRADRLIDANAERIFHFPLIERNLSKADCLGLLTKAGIELPEMYRLGFNNANCIGCVKGGQAYWLKIREIFPERFEEMAQMEEAIGTAILRYRSGPKKGQGMPLREIQPTKRKVSDEPEISCSVHCELAEMQIEDT